MMNTRDSARLALVSVLLFFLLLIVVHFLEPDFDPSRNLISEYELGRHGWVMSLAFFSLGIGVLGMLHSTWELATTRSGLIARGWFLVISIAFFGAGIFYPYQPANNASLIHGICGLIIIVTFPIAASLYSSSLAQSPDWIVFRGRLRWATLLVWIGLLSFAGSIVILGILFRPVDRTTATLPIGWQNRFMILTYCIWLMVIAWRRVALANVAGP